MRGGAKEVKDSRIPRLSIGLPVYNGERFLAGTIESLLGQTFGDFELIIADNASTDSTRAICERYAAQDIRIRYVRSDVNAGAARNFNRTVELARGQYFKWAAHDDLHAPLFLARCIEILDRRPEVVLCFSRTEFIDDDGNTLREYPFPVNLDRYARKELFLLYAIGGHIVHEIFGVIRLDELRRTPLIGGYVGSDHVLLGVLSLRGHFYQIPEVLFYHREHAGRSTLATGGTQGYTRWFDPSRSGRFVLPYWRRIFENSKSVIRADIGWREKQGCLWQICRAANWNRTALKNDLRQLLLRNLRAERV
jgi:glycosyltransferase involved in cell wall biosynthesis